jgi:hypothetical protein
MTDTDQIRSKRAQAYLTDFAEGTKFLSEEAKRRRQWVGSMWTDALEGKEQDIKLLEYACGPGYITMVGPPWLHVCWLLLTYTVIGSRTLRDKGNWSRRL